MSFFRAASIDRARHVAFENVASSVDVRQFMPEQVFKRSFSEFRFFESDQIFSPTFVHAVKALLSADHSSTCCLVNLSRTHSMTYNEAAILFLEAQMSEFSYDAQLRMGGPSKGWLFDMERYGCASDGTKWSIYCEKNNDIAVIALQDHDAVERFSSGLQALNARAIDTIIEEGADAGVPFSMLVPAWRDELVRLYGNGGRGSHRAR